MYRIFRSTIPALALLCLGLPSALALEMMTYTYMDKDRDGKVTKKEWTSSSTSFKARDWNNDGVLSGDELRVGYKGKKDLSFEEVVQVRFEELDINRDEIISLWEWPSKKEYFEMLDDNGDKSLTRMEFHDRRDETPDAFTSLDKNKDGVLSRKESKLDKDEFQKLDDNRDGKLTRSEFFDKHGPTQNSFQAMDRNKDSILSPFEWRGSREEFKAIDTDNNGVVTLIEFNARPQRTRPGMK